MKATAILATIICVACATPQRSLAGPEYLTYEGRNAIHEGQGGEKKTVEGIDFWTNGDPPHKFQVLGSLTDRRLDSGIIGWIRMSGFSVEIAKAAKRVGADAVILQGERDDVIGVSGYGSASFYRGFSFGSAWSAPITKHNARFIVVKYLPDDTIVPAPPTPPLPPISPQASQPSPERSIAAQPRCGIILQPDGSSKLVPC